MYSSTQVKFVAVYDHEQNTKFMLFVSYKTVNSVSVYTNKVCARYRFLVIQPKMQNRLIHLTFTKILYNVCTNFYLAFCEISVLF